MSGDNDQEQESTETQQSSSEPERDEAPPDIELVLNSEDPDKNRTTTIITENEKK
jgi:hypothetical protein